MTEEDKDNKSSENIDEELREHARKVSKGLFDSSYKSDFDERELASGDVELLEKSDAELFPDEIEEYTDEEKKPRVVVDNELDVKSNDS